MMTGARRRWWLLVIAVASLAGAGVALVGLQSTDDALLSYEERPAPPIELPDLVDPTGTVTVPRPGTPVVLNIWASWCVPCRREMPVLREAYARFGDQVAFIGVNHLDQRDEAIDFVAETGVGYPSGYDPDGSVARTYGAFGVPTTYFITASGRIVAAKTGELSSEELSSQIDRLVEKGA